MIHALGEIAGPYRDEGSTAVILDLAHHSPTLDEQKEF
jgi:hypothetical protein